MRYVLGVDGGGTKTLAVVTDERGRVKGLGRSGGSNFQSAGREGARQELEKAIQSALDRAGLEKVDAACYAIAGADRDRDFGYIREILSPIDPSLKHVLVNDTIAALRAGTPDGVGVALIGGTGSNCIGMNEQGTVKKAWGLGKITGDKANAWELVEDAIVVALKGVDGRGPETALEPALARAFGVEELVDIIEFSYRESPRLVNYADFSKLVFEVAAAGDEVARELLREHGRAAAEAALAVLRSLFSPDEKVSLVLGGSVLQKGADPSLTLAIKDEVEREFPLVEMIVLEDEPITGAVLRALDELHGTSAHDLGDTVREELDKHLKSDK